MDLLVLDKQDSWTVINHKLQEEVEEVAEEILFDDNKEDLAGELLDVIQVAIGGLDKLSDDISISKAIKRHNDKLTGRGWQVKDKLTIK